MRIAVVGMGVAGVSVVIAMAKHREYKEHEIVIYDKPDTFGTGLPYQPDSELLLLNQTADTMSLDYEDEMGFVKWVEKKKGCNDSAKKHLPRSWYGQYMQEKLEEAVKELNPIIVKEEVTSLEKKEGGTFLVQSNTGEKNFDLIHLCIGHLPYQDPYQLIDNPCFIYHPYPAQEKLANIEKGLRVGVVGTSLTAIDMMRFLKHEKEEIQLHFFSDTGRFSTLRGNEPKFNLHYLTLERLNKEKENNNGFVSLEKIFQWFKQECADKEINWADVLKAFGEGTKDQMKKQLTNEGDLGRLQSLLHHLDDLLPEFWLALNERDKQQFLEKYRDSFEIIRSPIPRETVQELVNWWEKGELTVRGGMQEVVELADSFEVVFETKETVEVDYLINATGQNKKVEQSRYQSKLLNQLINQRILQPETFGGVQVLWPSSEAISQRHGVFENLFVHGQLIQGIQYGNNTAGMLVKHAHEVVTKIVQEKRTSPP